MFHLHGFRQLGAYSAGARSRGHDSFWAEIVESWLIAEARPSLPGWHPYPTSLRLIAWCSALGAIDGWSVSLRERLAAEIARQARYLRRAVEYDIGGNHVLKNATALVFAGVTVPGSRVLAFGLKLLERELQRQILSDGGHEERSTSYHREVSQDLAEVSELLSRAAIDVPDWLNDASLKTQNWTAALAGPDGRLPMLNDAWEGPPLNSARDRHPHVTVLPDTGYVVLRHGDDQAVLDCGPLCPAHLPAHAHADALSFVLWLDGQLIVADPGSYTYTGADRAAFRSTAAHSTVEVDGQDQCVFWGDFRASYLPRVQAPRVRTCDGVTIVESSHDGYARQNDRIIHHRAFIWVPRGGIVIFDRVECAKPHTVCTRLPLSPLVDPSGIELAGVTVSPLTTGENFRAERSRYSPFLGSERETSCFVDSRNIPPGEVFGWRLLRDDWDVHVVRHSELEIICEGDDPIRIDLSSPD